MNTRPPPFQTREDAEGDPSFRNGKPYHQQVRNRIWYMLMNEGLCAAKIRQLRDRQRFPSHQTVLRIRRLVEQYGHCRPCQHSGGRRPAALRGSDMLFLAIFRLFFPTATAAEVNAFLYRVNFGNPFFRFFSPSQITRAEQNLGLTSKRGSTTARQAYYPINVEKRWIFWNMPYPYGIADIRTEDFIDCDECGIFMLLCARRRGKAYIGCRVNEEGPYSRSEKWNFLMAVSGERGTHQAPSRRWTKMWLEGGTTLERFSEFIIEVLDTLPHGDEGRRYCFVMDNLIVHHSPEVAALIYGQGHRIAFRAPYYAKDGPIEYVFNSLQRELNLRMHQIHTEADLLDNLGNVVYNMVDFQPYFRHCGFWR